MGLRDRLKKIKNRSGSNTPSGNSTPKIEYYKPGEEPKPKYRGKIDKEHSDKLQAFTFSDAWNRRKSNFSDGHGTMSPGGTMAQSRATSFIGSLRRKSVASASGSDRDRDNKDMRRKSTAAPPETATVKENEVDDTNVANAGLSRPQTANAKQLELTTVPTEHDTNGVALEKTATNGGLSPTHDTPFSTEELEKALTRVTIQDPGRVVSRGGEIAAH